VRMKDGAMLCNSGHFDIEIDLPALAKEARTVNAKIREHVDEYVLKNGHRLYVLGEGRLVNLAAAHGHPASVMDMSFATQALPSAWSIKNKGKLAHQRPDAPEAVDHCVASLKLQTIAHSFPTLPAEHRP